MSTRTPGTLSIRVPGFPEPLAFGDWVHDSIFGTVTFGTTQSATLRGLQATVSEQKPGAAAGTNLTERETNLPGPGNSGLPSAWSVLVYSIQIVVGPGDANVTLANMRDIHIKTLFRFKISTKTYSEGPVYRFPAAGGVDGMTTLNATSIVNNSSANPGGRRGFVIPHFMKPGVPFAGEFSFDAALALSAALDIETALEGLIKRPVL